MPNAPLAVAASVRYAGEVWAGGLDPHGPGLSLSFLGRVWRSARARVEHTTWASVKGPVGVCLAGAGQGRVAHERPLHYCIGGGAQLQPPGTVASFHSA